MRNNNVVKDDSLINFINYCPLVLKIIGIIMIGASLSVLVGWIYHITVLISVMPSWVSMKINTAICFFMSGIILELYSLKNQELITRIVIVSLSIFIILINCTILYLHATGSTQSLEELVSSKSPLILKGDYSERVPLITPINFLLIGLTLFYALKKSVSGWIIQLYAWFILFIGVLGIYNYVYEINMIPFLPRYTYMAFPTALLFILLGLGIFLLKPQTGIIGIILKNSTGGYFMRCLIAVGLLVPMGVAIIENKIIKFNLIEGNFDDSLFAIITFAFLSIALAFIAFRIDQEENKLTSFQLQSDENEHILREFTENIDIVLFRFSPDFTKLLYVSPAYERIWGKSVDSLYKNPKQWFEAIFPEDQPIVRDGIFDELVEEGKSSAVIEYRIKKSDNSPRNIFTRFIQLKDTNKKAFCIIGIAIDMTETKMKKKYIQLQYTVLSILEQEQLFIRIAAQTLQIICQTFDWEIGEIWLINEKKQVLYCYNRYDKPNNKMTIYENKSGNLFKLGQGLPGIIWKKRKPIYFQDYSADPKFLNNKEKIELKSALGTPILFQNKIFGIMEFFSYKTHYPDEELMRLIKSIGKLLGAFVNKTNAQEKIQLSSHYDLLTGLLNRSGFEDQLNKLITDRTLEFIAVLILDINGFKIINEALGHFQGDLLLKLIAVRLSEIDDVHQTNLARLEGDIFILTYYPLSKIKELDEYIQALKCKFIKPFFINDKELKITVTFGIAIYPKDGETTKGLIKNAGQANTSAKSEKGNNIKFYNSKLSTIATEKLDLNMELYRAIANHELFLNYQPQVDLKTGDISGAEALIRWQHPVKGLISPGKFIHVAEQTGLIVALNEHIIRMVFQQIKSDWSGPPISINISAQQFNDGFHLIEFLKSLKEEFAINPECIELEITEGLIMNDTQHNLEVLKGLHNLGFQISIDDFGTGFSSFSYLHLIPVHKIKIDISFIKGLPENKTNVNIVKGMISLFHSLGKIVVAEGVETAAENEFLKQEGCDIIQGFYYYRPISADDFFALLAKKDNDKKSF